MENRSQIEATSGLTKICSISDIPAPSTIKEFMAGRRFICVANVDGELYATDNTCPHWGGPLGQGTIENGRIVCPWHRWEYDPKTGKTPRKSDVRLAIFKLKLEGNDLLVEL